MFTAIILMLTLHVRVPCILQMVVEHDVLGDGVTEMETIQDRFPYDDLQLTKKEQPMVSTNPTARHFAYLEQHVHSNACKLLSACYVHAKTIFHKLSRLEARP